MITPSTYGHSGKTSASYYWFGIANNFSKLEQGGPVVEAAWMGALVNTFSFPLSNLGRRPVDTYVNVRSTTRFNPPSVGIEHVIPLFTHCARLIPTDPAWVPYL